LRTIELHLLLLRPRRAYNLQRNIGCTGMSCRY